MLLANTYNTPFDLVYDELAQSPSSQMVKPEGQAEQVAPGLYIAVPGKRVLINFKRMYKGGNKKWPVLIIRFKGP